MAENGATDKALSVASKAPLPPQAKAAVEVAKVLKESKNFWSIAKEFLWGDFEKRVSNTVLIAMLVIAGILDLLSLVPIVEIFTDLFAICIFFPWFLLLRYRFQKNIIQKFTVNIAAPIIEFIPALSALPGIIFAVGYNLFQMRLEDWMKYKENKGAEETAQKEEQERQQRAQEAQLELEAQADEQRRLKEAEDAESALAEIEESQELEEQKEQATEAFVPQDMVPPITRSGPSASAKVVQGNFGNSTENRGIPGGNQLGKAA